jgi:hypothetical protein
MQRGETVSLAGFRFFRFPINNVTMSFRTDDGQLFKGSLSTLSALIPTKIDKNTLKGVKDIPNIIGHDFMEENKMAFYFNPNTKVAYLEC